MNKPVRDPMDIYRRIGRAMQAAAEAGKVFDINSLDALDPKGEATFDRRRDVDERGLVERDAYSQENPRQFQGGREY